VSYYRVRSWDDENVCFEKSDVITSRNRARDRARGFSRKYGHAELFELDSADAQSGKLIETWHNGKQV